MAENKKPKKAMGRGLGALFMDHPGGDVEEVRDIVQEIEAIGMPSPDEKKVVLLKTVDIEPNKGQPRKHFDQEKLESLRDSIAVHGVVQPILVTPTKSGTYRIVAGERRWRASKLAGLKEIPCIIRSFEDQEVMELALVENLQREDLNPIEEAEGYQKLIDTFHLTQEEISKKVGKSRSAVANSLRLNHLGKKVKELLVEGSITQGHARALLSVEEEDVQLALAQQIIEKQLTVRQIEAMVADLGKENKKKLRPVSPLMQKYIKEIEDSLKTRFGTKVKIREGSKKGKIEIEYYSKEDLERLLFELRR